MPRSWGSPLVSNSAFGNQKLLAFPGAKSPVLAVTDTTEHLVEPGGAEYRGKALIMSAEDCILLVEDDDNDALIMQFAFEKVGIKHPLSRVSDGMEAIHFLQGSGKDEAGQTRPLPALVILDIQLPHKDGFEVLVWLRKVARLESLPVIIFSSSALQDDIEKAYRLGANSYVVKPPDINQTFRFVELLHDYWLRFNARSHPQRVHSDSDPKSDSGILSL